MKFEVPSAFWIHHESIDLDHKRMCIILDKAWEAFHEDKLYAFEPHFEAFLKAFEKHFLHEEDEMRAVGYHDVEAHARHHEYCVQQIQKLRQESREQGFLSKSGLIHCYDTLIYDVVKADLDFGNFLARKKTGTPDRTE